MDNPERKIFSVRNIIIACILIISIPVIYVFLNCRNANVAIPVVEKLNSDEIQKITIKLERWDEKAKKDATSEYDVTDAKEEIVARLKESEFYNDICLCVDIGTMIIEKKNGAVIEFGFSDHRFRFIKPKYCLYSYDEFRNQEMDLFILALLYDPKARVYDIEGLEPFLLPRAEKGDLEALALLSEYGSKSLADVLPDALVAAAKDYKQGDVPIALFIPENLILPFTNHKDLNVVILAFDILNNKFHLYEVSQNKDYACTNLAFWFALGGDVESTLNTIRTMGVENYDLSMFDALLKLLKKSTWGDGNRELCVLIADIIESQKEKVSINLLNELWNSMDMEYDMALKKLVPKGKASSSLEQKDIRANIGDIAKLIKDWANNKWPLEK